MRSGLKVAQQRGGIGEAAFHSVDERSRIFQASGDRAKFFRGKIRPLGEFLRQKNVLALEGLEVSLQALLPEGEPDECAHEQHEKGDDRTFHNMFV